MRGSDAHLHVDQQLCFALYSATRAVTRAYQPLLEPLGLTYPQYLVMLVLWEEEGLSLAAIGRRLGLDSGTLTPLLRRLEKSRLVRRARDPEGDDRVVRFHLTPSGRALKAKARQVPEQLLCRVGLDPTDGDAIRRLVELRDGLHGIVAKLGERVTYPHPARRIGTCV